MVQKSETTGVAEEEITFEQYEQAQGRGEELSFEQYELSRGRDITFSSPADPNDVSIETGKAFDLAVKEDMDLNFVERNFDNIVGFLKVSKIAAPALPYMTEKPNRPRSEELIDAAARGWARVGSGLLTTYSTVHEQPAIPTFPIPITKTPLHRESDIRQAKQMRQDADLLWRVAQSPHLAAQNTDIASKALNLIGETLPYISATTGAYILTGPLGGFAVASSVEGNSAYRTALDSGVEDEKAKQIGVLVGLASGSIEAVGGKLTEKAFSRLSKRITSKVLRKGYVFGIGTVVEALEEGGQEIAQIVGEETYRDVQWKEVTNRVLSSMAGGAFLGGVMKGGGIAFKQALSGEKGEAFQQALIKNGYSEEATKEAASMLKEGRSVHEVDKMLAQDTFGIEPAKEAKPKKITDKEVQKIIPTVELKTKDYPKFLEIERIDATPTGMGAGTKALKDLIAETDKPIRLTVQPRNVRAKKLYEKLGFKEIEAEDPKISGIRMQYTPVEALKTPIEAPTEAPSGQTTSIESKSPQQAEIAPEKASKEPWEMTREEFDNYKIDENKEKRQYNLYHATDSNFEIFSKKHAGFNTNPEYFSISKLGHFFTSSLKDAKTFADLRYGKDAKVIKRKVILKNPLILEGEWSYDILQQKIEEYGSPAKYVKALKENGYDGIIIIKADPYTWKTDEYVVFDKKQIIIDNEHKLLVQQAVKENKPVPRVVLEEYKTEPWAQEAIAKQAPEKAKEGGKKPKGQMPETASGGMPIPPPGLTRAEMQSLAKKQQKPPNLMRRQPYNLRKGEVAITKEQSSILQGKGYTLAEIARLSPKEATGLIEAFSSEKRLREAQKRGYPVGYKKGYQEAALDGRRKLGKLREDIMISKASKENAMDVVKTFIPKERQGEFINGLLNVKNAKDVERITNRIERFVDVYEHRGAVREFKKFVKQTRKKYNRGEIKLGKLTGNAKKVLEAVLSEYDTVALSEAKAEDLTKHKEHIQKIAGSISRAFREWENIDAQGLDIYQLPNRKIMDLERLEKIPIKDMTTDEIQYIQDELQSLVSNEARKAEIKKRIRSERAHTYITEASNEVAQRGTTKRGELKEPGLFKKFFNTNQANIRTLVRSMTTKDAKATEEFLVDRIYEAKRKAQDVHKKWFIDARSEFQKAKISEKIINGLYEEIPLTLGGKNIKAPRWILLNLYMNAEADGNLKRLLTAREHLLPSIKGKTIDIGKIKLEELQRAIAEMPAEYRTIADIMFKLNQKNNAPAINETSMWERGYPIAVYEKYFPFPRKLRNVPQGHRTEIQQALENRGRFQRRTGGNLPHIFKDPMAEFLNGMQLDAQYSTMSLELQDAKALLGNNKWRTRMDKAGNKPIVDSLIKMYQRAEGLSSDRNIADILGGKYLATMGKGTLSVRPTGGFIQTASLSAAYPVIERRYFSNTYIPKPSDVDKLMEKDASMWWRWKNRQFDFVLGSSSQQNAVLNFITGKDKISDGLLRHYTWGDQWAMLKIWEAAQNKAEATTNFKRGSRQFDEEALKIFHRAAETQPQWDTWHRSIFTSEPRALDRSFALFMSARNAQYNVVLQAMDDYNKGRIDKRTYAQRVGNVVEANLKVSIYRKLFRNLIKYGTVGVLYGVGKRDEEDIKRYIKKDLAKDAKRLPQELVFNLVGLPVYGQIIATVADEGLRAIQGKWSRVKFGDVRTGSIITDFLVDLGMASYDIGKFGRDLVLQTEYQSGKKEGQPRWPDSGLEVVNDIAEITSQLTGLGYAGPRSDIVWPVKNAIELSKAPDVELIINKVYKLSSVSTDEQEADKLLKQLKNMGVTAEDAQDYLKMAYDKNMAERYDIEKKFKDKVKDIQNERGARENRLIKRFK